MKLYNKYRIIFLTSLLFGWTTVLAQKSVLDTSVYRCWPVVSEEAKLSNDGNFAAYSIETRNKYDDLPNKTILKQTNGKWFMNLGHIDKLDFVTANNSLIFKRNDSLYVIDLKLKKMRFLAIASSFEVLEGRNNAHLIYSIEGKNKKLVVSNLKAATEINSENVLEYIKSKNNEMLFVMSHINGQRVLAQLDLKNDFKKEIFSKSGEHYNLICDNLGNQVAFMLKKSANDQPVLCYYNRVDNSGKEINESSVTGLPNEFEFGHLAEFTQSGDRLLLNIISKQIPTSEPGAIGVDIWSYTDVKMKSADLDDSKDGYQSEFRLAALDPHQQTLLVLTKGNEWLTEGVNRNSWVLIRRTHTDSFNSEYNWNNTSRNKFYLVSIISGKRIALPQFDRFTPKFSPTGRFVFGIDSSGNDLVAYDLTDNRSHYLNINGNLNLSIQNQVPVPAQIIYSGRPDSDNLFSKVFFNLISWLDGDKAIVVSDFYDLWQVDPTEKAAPINLTNKLGKKNNTCFLPLTRNISNALVGKGSALLLTTFNYLTKDAGFAKVKLSSKPSNPVSLSSGPYSYLADASVIKAENSQRFLLLRSSERQSPNYFTTSDFKNFSEISSIHPELNYNWYTSELHDFMTLDEKLIQGVLYKPENFDKNLRYPLIIHYYENKSEDLHKYHYPGPMSGGELDISWFVSRGYLVFTPDIRYETGNPYLATYNSIMGAVKSLKSLPFIDQSKIGIQGHSWGGAQTNFLITKTDKFAAAISSSGFADLFSHYSTIDGSNWTGSGHAFFDEVGQNRMGSTMWERPDLYLKASPVFELDKVNTPVLTIANKRDYRVNFDQGLALFTGLRRLGKRAWMLQYDEGAHGLSGKSYVDYVIRSTQFFDHYLKGAPAPVWMTRGIPAKYKGIKTGFEYDTEIKTPGPGLVTPEEQKKIDEYSKIPLSEKLKRFKD